MCRVVPLAGVIGSHLLRYDRLYRVHCAEVLFPQNKKRVLSRDVGNVEFSQGDETRDLGTQDRSEVGSIHQLLARQKLFSSAYSVSSMKCFGSEGRDVAVEHPEASGSKVHAV